MKRMKKYISILLSVLMMLGSCTIALCSAEDSSGGSSFAFDENMLKDFLPFDDIGGFEIPDFEGYDLDVLIQSGVLGDVSLGCLTLDEIYQTHDFSPSWSDVKNDPPINSSVLFLAMGNISVYLKNLVPKYFLDKNDLFTSANATKLANWLRHLIFGSGAGEDVTVVLKQDEIGQQEAFCKAVLTNVKTKTVSLKTLLQEQWMDKGVNYLPLLYALDFNPNNAWEVIHDDIFRQLVITMNRFITKLMNDPFYTMLDLIWALSRSYYGHMAPIFESLFYLRNNNDNLGLLPEDYKNPKEVLNLIFNGHNSEDGSKLQFISPPYARIGQAGDRVEVFYYLMVYFLLNTTYKNNRAVLEHTKQYVRDYTGEVVTFSAEDKDNICKIISGLTTGDINALVEFTTGTITTNVTNSFINAIKKFFQTLKERLESIVKALDSVFGFFGRWKEDTPPTE